MSSKYKQLFEIICKGPKAIKETEDKPSKKEVEPIVDPIEEKTFDVRLQDKFITRGNWSIQSLEDFKNDIPKTAEDIVPFKNEQPAIGLYDEKTLKRIQKNFPYKIKKRQEDED